MTKTDVTILLPLDGSPLAERALGIGVHLAKASTARLVLARVLASECPSAGSWRTRHTKYLDTRPPRAPQGCRGRDRHRHWPRSD